MPIMNCVIATSGGVQLSVEDVRMRQPVHEDCTEGNIRFLQRLGDRSCLDAKSSWVDPRAGLDDMEKFKFLTPRSSSPYEVAVPTTLS
jgi:hypothetical protein